MGSASAIESAGPAASAGQAGGVRAAEAAPERTVADPRSGAISLDQALDRLVAQALEGPEVRLLNAAGRRALEEHLRTALRDDPALRAAVSDLSKA